MTFAFTILDEHIDWITCVFRFPKFTVTCIPIGSSQSALAFEVSSSEQCFYLVRGSRLNRMFNCFASSQGPYGPNFSRMCVRFGQEIAITIEPRLFRLASSEMHCGSVFDHLRNAA